MENLFFEITTSQTSEYSDYHHLSIVAYNMDDRGIDPHPSHAAGTVEFNWQCTHGEWRWYAGSIETDADSIAKMKGSASLANKITRTFENQWRVPAPLAIVERLRKMGAVQTVYDKRIYEHVPVTEVQPSDMERWAAEYTDRTIGVLTIWAEDEADALGRFIIMANDPEDRDHYAIKQWLTSNTRSLARRTNFTPQDAPTDLDMADPVDVINMTHIKQQLGVYRS